MIVGNWNNSHYGKTLFEQYYKYKNIILLHPIYDPIELNKLRSNATIYIHGHSAGGTNPSLVEAMYLGLPCICFDVNYNRYTTENKALYFRNKFELSGLLKQLNFQIMKENAQHMTEIAHRRYLWKKIARKYATCLKLVLNEEYGLKPAYNNVYKQEVFSFKNRQY